MSSWWQLGEATGYEGTELRLYRITCPFCDERGNFETVSHHVKRKPNSSKQLNFDTLECGNCKGYVMVFWSAGNGLHNFHVLPWPLTFTRYPEYWPEELGRFWVQAKRNLADENWDATVVMARSALQFALRDNKAKGRSLFEEINDLAAKGVLPPIMKDWATNVRELGNDATHLKWTPSAGPLGPVS
jgi:hypothetical protein